MKYLKYIINPYPSPMDNGLDFSIIIIMVVIGAIIIYFYNWLNPSHKNKMSQTLEEYYQHIKEEHPDIWEKYDLTDKGIKEFIRKVREKENES